MERNGGSGVVVGWQEWRKWRSVERVDARRSGFGEVEAGGGRRGVRGIMEGWQDMVGSVE